MVRIVTNFTKLPDEILIDMINADNGTQFKVGDLAFGIPSPIQGNVKRNTALEVYAGVESQFAGSVKINYNRLPLDYKIQGDLEFAVDDARRTRDLVPAINRRFGINLTPDDYVDEEFSAPAFGEVVELSLTATHESLVWIGSVTLSLINDVSEGIPLSLVIKDVYLDTLDNSSVCPTST